MKFLRVGISSTRGGALRSPAASHFVRKFVLAKGASKAALSESNRIGHGFVERVIQRMTRSLFLTSGFFMM